MIRFTIALFAAGCLACIASVSAQATNFCAPPTWTPGRVVRVNSAGALQGAVRGARAGDTVLVADGTYAINQTLDIGVPRFTLRGASGDRTRVVIRGGGMTSDGAGVGIGVNAPDVTIADLTVRDFGFHDIQVRGEQGASRFTTLNVRLMDAGQQLLKGSLSGSPVYADNGTVACSEFSFTESAPTDYTNGVDILGTKGWTIRDNRFLRIRGPRSGNWSAGPAILAWASAEDTVVERNVIIDSFRGIALGLAAGTASYTRNGERAIDHRGGLIRNNVIVNLNSWADEAIEANAASEVRIEHNTVLVEGSAPWSIGVRFPTGSALIRNNLTNRQILLRNGGRATTAGNVIAERSWFVDPPAANLRLTPASSTATRVGVSIPDTVPDFDGVSRSTAANVTVGAFELAGGARP